NGMMNPYDVPTTECGLLVVGFLSLVDGIQFPHHPTPTDYSWPAFRERVCTLGTALQNEPPILNQSGLNPNRVSRSSRLQVQALHQLAGFAVNPDNRQTAVEEAPSEISYLEF